MSLQVVIVVHGLHMHVHPMLAEVDGILEESFLTFGSG